MVLGVSTPIGGIKVTVSVKRVTFLIYGMELLIVVMKNVKRYGHRDRDVVLCEDKLGT